MLLLLLLCCYYYYYYFVITMLLLHMVITFLEKWEKEKFIDLFPLTIDRAKAFDCIE